MNKKILSILAFNFLIFSFQLDAMKRNPTSPRDVPGGYLPSSPFCCGTPPATPGSPADEMCEFSLEVQNKLPVFKLQELNKFIIENKLNLYSVFSEDWKDIVCEYGEDFRIFCPASEVLFIVAYAFCNYNQSDCFSVFEENLNSCFWSWVKGMFVCCKNTEGNLINVVYKSCVKTFNGIVFPQAILIAVQEEDLTVQQFLKNKIEEYNEILNPED